jgi:Fe-S-cluster containining protein
MYININDLEKIHFSSCDGCLDSCCSSSKFIMAPLILEDIKEVYNHFPIFFASIDNETRLVMILGAKESNCPYFEEDKCSIYEQRPPACKLYPLSPYYDEILIDTSCNAVGSLGDIVSKNGKCTDKFYYERFDNFITKISKTKEYINKRENKLDEVDEIVGIKIFNYIGEMQDEHQEMISSSQKHYTLFDKYSSISSLEPLNSTCSDRFLI